jgi:3-carboxy-cis,cis-muconate cycloisomerase
MSLYSHFFYADDVREMLSESQAVSNMLRVESSLAKAQAKNGIIAFELAEVISSCCSVERIDIELLKQEISLGGNAAIPLVKQLTKLVKIQNFEASKYVHFGATSQDIIDTATVLGIKTYINWLENTLNELIENLGGLSKKYRETPMIGRTLLQQAKPITFGLKTAGWLSALLECQEQLEQLKGRLLKIQLSGAVGAGNAAITKDVQVSAAEILGLRATSSWQSQRGSLVEWSSFLGILSGNLGKMAKDISLLMQTEVGEVFEGAAEGKGGSSTMPHKRNPVGCAAIIANSNRIPSLVSTMLSNMLQEHERSAGLWHAEWESLQDLMLLTAGSLAKSVELIRHLEVDEKRMAANLELTKGLIYAENVSLSLAKEIGKMQAHETVEKACKVSIKTNTHLKKVIAEMDLGIENLEELFKAEKSIGNSLEIIDEILSKTQTDENKL